MQITLNQDEILEAVKGYVRSQINIASNQDIMIDLRAGRGENGFTATLDIVPSKTAKPYLTRAAEPQIADTAPAEVLAPKTPAASNPFAGKRAAANPFKAAAQVPVEEAEPEAQEETPDPVEEAEDTSAQDQDVAEEGEEEKPAEPAPAPRSIFSKAKVG